MRPAPEGLGAREIAYYETGRALFVDAARWLFDAAADILGRRPNTICFEAWDSPDEEMFRLHDIEDDEQLAGELLRGLFADEIAAHVEANPDFDPDDLAEDVIDDAWTEARHDHAALSVLALFTTRHSGKRGYYELVDPDAGRDAEVES